MRIFVLLLMMAVAATGLSLGYGWITGRPIVSLGGPGVTEKASGSALDASSQGSIFLDPSAPSATATSIPASPTPPSAPSTLVPPTPGVTIVPATPAASPIPFLPIAGATATPIPGFPAAQPTPDPNFKPWWVQNSQETRLWSGTDDRAISFGSVPPSSYFLVVEPQQGARLHVFNPLTQNYAYIDASAVAPSSPPPGAASPPGAAH